MEEWKPSDMLMMYSVLKGDVIRCVTKAKEENLTEADDLFWRRMIVKSAFSYIEGVTYRMKQQAYEAYQVFTNHRTDQIINFTPAELSFMVEEDYEVNDKGEIVTVRARIPLAKSLRLAFKVYARANFSNYELNSSDHRWDSFKKTIKLRDRLMHPKNVQDLFVTDSELELLIDTIAWFEENSKGLFDSTIRDFSEYNRIFGEERMQIIKERAEAIIQKAMSHGLLTDENSDMAGSIRVLLSKVSEEDRE